MIPAGAAGGIDPQLRHLTETLALPGLLVGYRVIASGDEFALLAEEAASITSPGMERRRASGAARRVARELMMQLGYGGLPVPRSASGAPVWPAGITGSIAHDERVAVAAVGRGRDFAAIGIDVELAVALPPEMLGLVATPRELRTTADHPLAGKLLFAAKEAVYKAVYPLDQVFLEFHDIEIDLAARTATTRSGRVLMLRYAVSSHVLVLASAQSGV